MSIVEDFLARYTGNTAAAYRRDWADWERWAEDNDILSDSPTRANVQSYVRALELQQKSPATVARRLATLSSFFKYAQSEGHIESNPAASVRRPKISDESGTRGLTAEELRSFLTTARSIGVTEFAFSAFLVTTAARVSEACNLRTEQLGTTDGHRTARITVKGGKEKLLVLSNAATAIDACLGQRNGEVFLRPDGRPFNRDYAYHLVRRIARLAGIEDWETVTPHSLRASALTVALENGSPLHIVQDFAGHSDPRTTQGYNKRRNRLEKSPSHGLSELLAI